MADRRTPWDASFLEARALRDNMNRALECLTLAARLADPRHSGIAYEIRRAMTHLGPAARIAERVFKDASLKHATQPDLIAELDTLEREVSAGIQALERKWSHGPQGEEAEPPEA